MLLMIWVNDFWSLTNVPTWLEHAPGDADAMGFSDIIFPAFLFIVGLSIPFALRSRLAKGDSKPTIITHILARSFALLLMGFLMVNLESYHDASTLLPRSLWQVAMALAFILIWNRYPSDPSWKKRQIIFKAAGWLILAGLAATFRSNPENGYNWLEPHWWGILGLIGWSYLLCSILQLVIGENALPNAIAWLTFASFNIAAFAGWLDFLAPVRTYVWIVGDGSLPALTMAGCFVSTLYLHFQKTEAPLRLLYSLIAIGLACLLAGLLLRPYWGISKIQATPAWTEICTGLSMLAFAFLYWLADLRKKTKWASFLKPAGVATLTCYLLPYLAYPAMQATGVRLPAFLTDGAVGLLTAMAFSLAIVFATGLLNRIGVRLKI